MYNYKQYKKLNTDLPICKQCTHLLECKKTYVEKQMACEEFFLLF